MVHRSAPLMQRICNARCYRLGGAGVLCLADRRSGEGDTRGAALAETLNSTGGLAVLQHLTRYVILWYTSVPESSTLDPGMSLKSRHPFASATWCASSINEVNTAAQCDTGQHMRFFAHAACMAAQDFTVAAPAGKWGPKSSRIFSGMLMLPVSSRSSDGTSRVFRFLVYVCTILQIAQCPARVYPL